MAEYRPYRVANQRAQARLTQIKVIAVSSFLLLTVCINGWVTQHARRTSATPAASARRCAASLCALGVAGVVGALALGRTVPAGMGLVH